MKTIIETSQEIIEMSKKTIASAEKTIERSTRVIKETESFIRVMQSQNRSDVYLDDKVIMDMLDKVKATLDSPKI